MAREAILESSYDGVRRFSICESGVVKFNRRLFISGDGLRSQVGKCFGVALVNNCEVDVSAIDTLGKLAAIFVIRNNSRTKQSFVNRCFRIDVVPQPSFGVEPNRGYLYPQGDSPRFWQSYRYGIAPALGHYPELS